MSRRRLFAVGCVLAIALGLMAWIVSSSSDDRADRLAYEVCRENNLPNAYLRLLLELNPDFDYEERGVPAPQVALPILSCQETVEASRPVRLRPEEERRYLRILARGRLPHVRDGEVVGSDPLPAPPRR